MLVYDITNEKSFDNIKNWIRNIEEVSLIGCHGGNVVEANIEIYVTDCIP